MGLYLWLGTVCKLFLLERILNPLLTLWFVRALQSWIFCFHFIYEEKNSDCILHSEILWPQIKRSGKPMQTVLMPCKTQREKSTLTNGEDLFRQNEIMQCFPGRITVSTVWISISRTEAKKLQYSWNKGVFAIGVPQGLLNEYMYSAFWSWVAMCVVGHLLQVSPLSK